MQLCAHEMLQLIPLAQVLACEALRHNVSGNLVVERPQEAAVSAKPPGRQGNIQRDPGAECPAVADRVLRDALRQLLH